MKTVLMRLKDSLQDHIGLADKDGMYNQGYKDCLISLVNSIDAKWLHEEKEQIKKTYIDGCYEQSLSGDYYELTYNSGHLNHLGQLQPNIKGKNES
jgi:hypothetical protein